MTSFKKATKQQAKLRLALDGPAGSGKTYTALTFASAIAEHAGGRVAVIDTERGSASLYADRFDFDVMEIQAPYDPAKYVNGLRDARAAGYPVVVIDSLSHAWDAEGGVMEIADRNKKGGNSWSGWAAATPAYRSMIEAILGADLHVICTMRTKTEWTTDDKGKPVKIGTAPVMRAGIDYEFTVVGDLDTEHVMRVSKSRCQSVADRAVRHPDASFARELIAWLDDGVEPVIDAERVWREAWKGVIERAGDKDLGNAAATAVLTGLHGAGVNPSGLSDDEKIEFAARLGEIAFPDDQAIEAEPTDDVEVDAEVDDPLGGGDAPRLKIPVTGSKGTEYTITVHEDGSWDCTCPARTPECRHVTQVRRPYPGGNGWLWPGDTGYEVADTEPDEQAKVDVPVTGVAGLMAYARELGVSEQQAMLAVAQAGGPDELEAARSAIRGLSARRAAAAEETGEGA